MNEFPKKKSKEIPKTLPEKQQKICETNIGKIPKRNDVEISIVIT